MLNTSNLFVYQSLWAMEDLPTVRNSWTLAEQIERIAGSGFAGLAVDLGARQAPSAEQLVPLLAGSGLRTAVFAFVSDDDAVRSAVAYAQRVGADRMVLCAQIYGFDPKPLAATLLRWYEIGSDAGIHIEIETHRNTVTNDLRFTAWLLDYLDERVELAGDLSHFVCANELPEEPTAEHDALFAKVLSRCGSLQGRIATRGQVQVPVESPAARPWEKRFRDWWRTGFEQILARRGAEAEIMFCTELGTRPYAITDTGGNEISDRWADALILKGWATEEFDAALALHSSTHDYTGVIR